MASTGTRRRPAVTNPFAPPPQIIVQPADQARAPGESWVFEIAVVDEGNPVAYGTTLASAGYSHELDLGETSPPPPTMYLNEFGAVAGAPLDALIGVYTVSGSTPNAFPFEVEIAVRDLVTGKEAVSRTAVGWLDGVDVLDPQPPATTTFTSTPPATVDVNKGSNHNLNYQWTTSDGSHQLETLELFMVIEGSPGDIHRATVNNPTSGHTFTFAPPAGATVGSTYHLHAKATTVGGRVEKSAVTTITYRDLNAPVFDTHPQSAIVSRGQSYTGVVFTVDDVDAIWTEWRYVGEPSWRQGTDNNRIDLTDEIKAGTSNLEWRAVARNIGVPDVFSNVALITVTDGSVVAFDDKPLGVGGSVNVEMSTQALIDLAGLVTQGAAPIDWSTLQFVHPVPGGTWVGEGHEGAWVDGVGYLHVKDGKIRFSPVHGYEGKLILSYRVFDTNGVGTDVPDPSRRITSQLTITTSNTRGSSNFFQTVPGSRYNELPDDLRLGLAQAKNHINMLLRGTKFPVVKSHNNINTYGTVALVAVDDASHLGAMHPGLRRTTGARQSYKSYLWSPTGSWASLRAERSIVNMWLHEIVHILCLNTSGAERFGFVEGSNTSVNAPTALAEYNTATGLSAGSIPTDFGGGHWAMGSPPYGIHNDVPPRQPGRAALLSPFSRWNGGYLIDQGYTLNLNECDNNRAANTGMGWTSWGPIPEVTVVAT